MMTKEHYKILLIDDDPVGIHLVKQMLAYAEEASCDLDCVDRLATGLTHLERGVTDAVLLDLGLRNTEGRDALADIRNIAPHVPVIVLTSIEDASAGLDAVRAGAQDYIRRGWTDSDVLIRAIRYSIERKQAERDLVNRKAEMLRQLAERARQEREAQSLERLAGFGQSPATARSFGLSSLREGTPDVFEELVRDYGELLNLALEQKAFKVDQGVSERLRSMAEQMGCLAAGPRDVVELHCSALKAKSRDVPAGKAQACAEEGRLMALELMGYLVTFYRNRSFAAGRTLVADACVHADAKQGT